MRALARSEAAAEKVRARGAEPVAGDLGDRGALEGGSVGCDVCFTLDISRARTELGYEPVRTREDGLAELAG